MRYWILAGCALLVGCHSSKDDVGTGNTVSLSAQPSLQAPVPPGYEVPSGGTLASTDLINIAKLRRDFVKSDAFSASYNDPPLVGRKFRAVIDISEGGKIPGTELGGWQYDADKHVLTLTVGTEHMDKPFTHVSMTHIPIAYEEETEPRTTEHNALGASVEVTHTTKRLISLEATENAPAGVFEESLKEEMGSSEHLYNGLSRDLQLDPATARATVKGMQLVIEGSIIKNDDHETECGVRDDPGTFSNPHAEASHDCIIYVHYDHMAYVKADGTVLAEWFDRPGLYTHTIGDQDTSSYSRSSEPVPAYDLPTYHLTNRTETSDPDLSNVDTKITNDETNT